MCRLQLTMFSFHLVEFPTEFSILQPQVVKNLSQLLGFSWCRANFDILLLKLLLRRVSEKRSWGLLCDDLVWRNLRAIDVVTWLLLSNLMMVRVVAASGALCRKVRDLLRVMSASGLASICDTAVACLRNYKWIVSLLKLRGFTNAAMDVSWLFQGVLQSR